MVFFFWIQNWNSCFNSYSLTIIAVWGWSDKFPSVGAVGFILLHLLLSYMIVSSTTSGTAGGFCMKVLTLIGFPRSFFIQGSPLSYHSYNFWYFRYSFLLYFGFWNWATKCLIIKEWGSILHITATWTLQFKLTVLYGLQFLRLNSNV